MAYEIDWVLFSVNMSKTKPFGLDFWKLQNKPFKQEENKYGCNLIISMVKMENQNFFEFCYISVIN